MREARHLARHPRGATMSPLGRTSRMVGNLPDGAVLVVPTMSMRIYVQRMLVGLYQRRHDALRIVSVEQGVQAIVGLRIGTVIGVDHAAFLGARFSKRQVWVEYLRQLEVAGCQVRRGDLA